MDLAHLVEMDERIEVVEGDAGERATDREPLPFEAARGVGQALDGAGGTSERVRDGDPWQDGDVGER